MLLAVTVTGCFSDAPGVGSGGTDSGASEGSMESTTSPSWQSTTSTLSPRCSTVLGGALVI